jgi:putative ABC transport system permease protein
MATLLHDLRLGLRAMRRQPGFAAAAVAALALGIGGSTAMFSVVDAVLLRPLPYPDPERIVEIAATAPERGLDATPLSHQRFTALAERSRSFTSIGATTRDTVDLTGVAEPVQLAAARISSGLLEVLGVRPLAGRNFLPDEDRPGGRPVVLLSHRLWRQRFGADPGLVGGEISLDGAPATVVGVMPPGFAFPDAAIDVWIPRVAEPSFLSAGAVERGSTYLTVVARLKPGATRQRAQAELDLLARADPRSDWLDAGFGYLAVPLTERIVHDVRPTLLILLGAVGCVLLIACANVAGLLLARAVGRRREMAIRAALGASRRRLVRQLLTESVLLATLGAACGLALATLGLNLLVAAAPDGLPRAAEIGIDGRVLAATALLALATGVLFGLAPALRTAKVELDEVLRESGRTAGGGAGRRHRRLGGVLVVAELALSVVLLVTAGLLLRSFLGLRAVEIGFDPGRLLVARIDLPPSRDPAPADVRRFYRRLEEELAALPGAIAVGGAETLPLGGSDPQTLLAVEGRPLPPLGEREVVSFNTVSPGYFRALGIPVVAGRAFTAQDDETAPIRVVVDQSFARRTFPDQPAVGRRVLLGRSTTGFEIIGVVGDVRHARLDAAPAGSFYLSANQRTVPGMAMVVRTAAAPLALGAAVRQRVLAIDPDQPVARLETMDDVVARSIADRRFTLMLLGGFAAVALVLAALGLYAVLAYWVGRRTGEIGLRMALGARGRDVVMLVVGRSLLLTLIGLAIGLAAAAAATRLVSTFLFGVTATDPLTFAGIAALLTLIAALASVLPARRASRVDPLVALRQG